MTNTFRSKSWGSQSPASLSEPETTVSLKSDRRSRILGAVCIYLLGLLPLAMWFRGDWLLKTSDIRIPVIASEWSQFWYAWNDQIGTGTAPLLDSSLLIYHGWTALLSHLSSNLVFLQKSLVALWFPIGGVAIYSILLRWLKGQGRVAAASAGAVFYLYNLWQETIWMGFKPPLIASYAVAPWMLYLFLEALDGRCSYRKIALWTGVGSLLIAALGNNPSEGIAVVGPFLIAFAVICFRDRQKSGAWIEHARLFAFCLAVWAAVNAFWILPQFAAVLSNVHGKEMAHIQKNIALQWLEGLSTYTSFSDVARLQADWTWHGGMVDAYRTHAIIYAKSGWLWVLSWISPLLALYGLTKSRYAQRGVFAMLAGLGIVLSLGAHTPIKPVFLWLFKNVPFFWSIRSPYYKFGWWIVLGYSVLIAFAISAWANRRPLQWKRWGAVSVGAIILVQMICTFPVVLGTMYTFATERTYMTPDRVRIPTYVAPAVQWLSEQKTTGRIFAIPGDNIWVNTWGYIGYGPILQYLSPVPVVFRYDPEFTQIAQVAANRSSALTKMVTEALFYRDTRHIDRILRLLGVQYLLQENDVRYNFYKGPGFVEHDSPAYTASRLRQQEGIHHAQRFGEWDFYELSRSGRQTTWVNQVALFHGDSSLVLDLLETPLLETPAIFWSDSFVGSNAGGSDTTISKLLKKNLVGALATDGSQPEPAVLDLVRKHQVPVWMAIRLGGKSSEKECFVPREGSWQCQAIFYTETYPPPARPAAVTLQLSDAAVEISEKESTLSLKEGLQTFRVEVPQGWNVALVLHQPGSQPWNPRITVFEEEKIDPTQYRLQGENSGPGVLIFHESADRGWKLRGAGSLAEPLIANGFAQGWLIESLSTSPIRIEFSPQRIVAISFWISAIALVLLFGYLLKK